MDAFPLFMKLEGRPCLVVGGGSAAVRKVELLQRAGARVTVVAPALVPELAEAVAGGRLRHDSAPFTSARLRGHVLAIAATDDVALARSVAEAARAAGVPLNVVDRPELSTFITGALVDRSPVLVAISTGGAAPVLAREVRLAIERLLPPSIGRLARFAERFRAAVKAAIPDALRRRRFWESFFEGPVASAVLAGDERAAQAAMLGLVNRGEPGASHGIVHLVGTGPGDPELLTLRAHRLLGEADVIVYDKGVDTGILERARRDAERFDVGESGGHDGKSQAEINAFLADLARAGKRVVRLNAGDPFIFGRGNEELEYLRARGISVEVVPGISAPSDRAAAALDLAGAVNA